MPLHDPERDRQKAAEAFALLPIHEQRRRLLDVHPEIDKLRQLAKKLADTGKLCVEERAYWERSAYKLEDEGFSDQEVERAVYR